MNVLKVLDLLGQMDGEKKQAVGDAIRGRVRTAMHQEVASRLAAAVDAASKAGMTDGEILDYVQTTLRRRARAKQIEQALIYRAACRPPGSKDRTC